MILKLKLNLLMTMLFFAASVVVYYLLNLVVNYVFLRRIPFINSAPIGFICCVSIAMFFSLFILRVENKSIFNLRWGLFFFFWLIISVVLGGVLWAYLDMGTINYIGYYDSFVKKAISNIKEAFFYGPIVLVLAFPYNVICLYFFFLIRRNTIKMIKIKK